MNNFVKKYQVVIVVFILAVMFVLEITSGIKESQIVDEGVHISAGYSYLTTGDFRMNSEHPPLIKYLSALPLLFLDLYHPTHFKSWQEGNEWAYAHDFVYHNRLPADVILFLGRMPVMLLSLLIAYFVYKWAKELFGPYAGLFALLLFAFSPNILAHSRYVTTDLGATLVILISIYYFGKYLENPKTKNLVIASIIFAIAQVTKFSALILLPCLIILYFIKWWQTKNQSKFFSFKNFLKTFIIIILVTSIIIFIFYGFEIKKPLDDPDVIKLYEKREEVIKSRKWVGRGFLAENILKITDRDKKSGQIIYQVAKKVPIPTYSYLKGFTQLAIHNYFGHRAYLLGHYSEIGFWYYFPITFLFKNTLAVLILIILLILFFVINTYFSLKNKGFITYLKSRPFHYYLLLTPVLIYFIWSLFVHINIGHRHLLPIYPFIFILFGYLIKINFKRFNYIYKLILLLMLIFHIISSLSIYPHFLAYFNEMAGGPAQGPKYLVDSNIDWGQDLKNLEKYIKTNKIDSLCLSYFGNAEISYYLKMDVSKIKNMPKFKSEMPECTMAISVTNLYSKESEYKWLLDYQPEAKIGYSIYIYDLNTVEMNSLL